MNARPHAPAEREQPAGLPVIFSPSPAASAARKSLAEALAASILRDEFLKEIHT